MSPNSPTSENNRRRYKKSYPSSSRTRPGSPTRPFSPPPPSATSLVDGGLLTEELSRSEISPGNPNPRSFPYSVKQQCWEKAEKIKGRDPDRWRRDALGNTVFRKLVGCPGCLCHDYDHILPYSKVIHVSIVTMLMISYKYMHVWCCEVDFSIRRLDFSRGNSCLRMLKEGTRFEGRGTNVVMV